MYTGSMLIHAEDVSPTLPPICPQTHNERIMQTNKVSKTTESHTNKHTQTHTHTHTHTPTGKRTHIYAFETNKRTTLSGPTDWLTG